jgi:hypothetical protein
MKRQSLVSRQEVFSDRAVLIALIALIASSLIFTIIVGLNIHPGELQVNTHYTAFGIENFYRTPWYYLLSFVGFGLLIGVGHSVIALKLFSKSRDFALMFLWLSVVLLGISGVLIINSLKIAALS